MALLEWTQSLPRNDRGQIVVPLFGDLKRHRITDPEVSQLGNELLAQRFVARDVFALTSMGDTKLQQLDEEADEDRPVYRDIAYPLGAAAARPFAGGDVRPSTGWHSQFADVNNDGLLDLFIAKGNVEAMPDFAANDPDNLLLGQWDETFVEVGDRAGIALATRGRGAALVDLNMDGMLDLVVVNREAPTSLFRNLGARTEWGACSRSATGCRSSCSRRVSITAPSERASR